MVSTAGASRATASSQPSRRGGDLAAPLSHPALGIPGSGRGIGVSGAGAGGGDVEANNAGPLVMAPPSLTRPVSVDGGLEDGAAFQKAEFLTREEVLQRRLRRVRQLERYYRRQYWGLMGAVRVRHRNYYWNFGRSPVEGEEGGGVEEEENGGFAAGMVSVGRSGEIGRVGVGIGGVEVGGNRKKDRGRCVFGGCKTKPMALTRFCRLHILADQKQRLYKSCIYPSKRWKRVESYNHGVWEELPVKGSASNSKLHAVL